MDAPRFKISILILSSVLLQVNVIAALDLAGNRLKFGFVTGNRMKLKKFSILPRIAVLLAVGGLLVFLFGGQPGPPLDIDPSTAAKGTVILQGGFETDSRDNGRPVRLIASALGVEPQVFRDAFSDVNPAMNGHPTEAHAKANKKILLDALGKYGVTNQRLDEVSNYYRYQQSRGEIWKYEQAEVAAIIKDGLVSGFEVVNPGSGYSSSPKIMVAGFDELRATVKLGFSTEMRKNGFIESVTID
jgi:hypothetical protein